MGSSRHSPTGTRESRALSKAGKLAGVENTGSGFGRRSLEGKQRASPEAPAVELHDQSRKGKLMVNQDTQHDELRVRGVEIEQRLRELNIKG